MRHLSLIAALPLLALTACGGASGPESVGSIAPPTAGGGTGGSGTGVAPTPSPSPTPTPSGGTGTGVTPTPSPTPTPGPTNFLQVTAAKSFDAIGSFHSLQQDEATRGVLYRGNASTVRTPTGSVLYDPRDGTFTINFVDDKAGISEANFRYQDPRHRTTPSMEYATAAYNVPDLQGFNYLQAVGPSNNTDVVDRITFFYQRPGTSTNYVSLAGYVRNAFTLSSAASFATSTSTYERGAMVFGEQTARTQIPVSGTATYTGGMIASMITGTNTFQWMDGTSTVNINFADASMTMALQGTLGRAYIQGTEVPAAALLFAAGSEFRATASGAIDLARSGGFTGQFGSVTIGTGGTGTVLYDRVNPNTAVAGANSIDGTFFGPAAVNVGGNFRIVGGVPNQRVDILGAFTGAKQ